MPGILQEYERRFIEASQLDLPCFLVMVTPGASIQADPTIELLPLTNVVIDDFGNNEHLVRMGVSLIGRNSFTVYSGDLDRDSGGIPLGRSSVVVPKLKAAMHTAGGIKYGDDIYALDEFYRGVILDGTPLEWILVGAVKSEDTM